MSSLLSKYHEALRPMSERELILYALRSNGTRTEEETIHEEINKAKEDKLEEQITKHRLQLLEDKLKVGVRTKLSLHRETLHKEFEAGTVAALCVTIGDSIWLMHDITQNGLHYNLIIVGCILTATLVALGHYFIKRHKRIYNKLLNKLMNKTE